MTTKKRAASATSRRSNDLRALLEVTGPLESATRRMRVLRKPPRPFSSTSPPRGGSPPNEMRVSRRHGRDGLPRFIRDAMCYLSVSSDSVETRASEAITPAPRQGETHDIGCRYR